VQEEENQIELKLKNVQEILNDEKVGI